MAESNGMRANRAFRAVFPDWSPGDGPIVRHEIAKALQRHDADLFHLCDQYGLDSSTIRSLAVPLYLDEVNESGRIAAVTPTEGNTNFGTAAARRLRKEAAEKGKAAKENGAAVEKLAAAAKETGYNPYKDDAAAGGAADENLF
jgi:hypothetical protein